jgi:hypothetical protein
MCTQETTRDNSKKKEGSRTRGATEESDDESSSESETWSKLSDISARDSGSDAVWKGHQMEFGPQNHARNKNLRDAKDEMIEKLQRKLDQQERYGGDSRELGNFVFRYEMAFKNEMFDPEDPSTSRLMAYKAVEALTGSAATC